MNQCPHCKQFILTPREKEAVALVKSIQESSTPWIARKMGTSIQSASNTLKKLADLGFIWREGHTAKSGGIEYLYYGVKP